jgi:hypothetical protein
MDNTDLALHSEYLIKLLRLSLNGKTVGSIPPEIDLKKIYYLACLHSVTPAVYPAIKELPEQSIEMFKEEYMKSWRKTALQYIESSSILSKADEFNVDCIPLKGSILKELYPSPEMRTMADLDFLCNIKKIEDVKLIMYQLGYIPQSESENHFVFYKEPLMNIEFHPNLLSPCYFSEHLNPGWQYAVGTGRDKPLRSLTKEGFLIHLVAHTAYHFINGGSGIRSVMDIWVYLNHYKKNLDNITLNRELRHAKLLDFYNNLKALAEAWFGDGEMTPLLSELGDYIIKSCTYGTQQNLLKSKLGADGNYKSNRRKYIVSSVFPSYKIMSGKYPKLKKYRFLLPIYWIKRIFSIILFKYKKAKLWIMDFSSVKESDVEKSRTLLTLVGLNADSNTSETKTE